MEQEKLKNLLKRANLNKKEFAKEVGLAYQTVNNWGSSKNVPHWVESWLKLYIQTRSFSELREKMKDSGICEDNDWN